MRDEDKTLITGDKRISDEEAKRLTTGAGVEIKSLEEFMALARMAEETKTIFDKMVEGMTIEQALQVRQARVIEGLSWRGVAGFFHELWGGTWMPPSNQLMGMALCEKAQALLGQGDDKEWN